MTIYLKVPGICIYDEAGTTTVRHHGLTQTAHEWRDSPMGNHSTIAEAQLILSVLDRLGV